MLHQQKTVVSVKTQLKPHRKPFNHQASIVDTCPV